MAKLHRFIGEFNLSREEILITDRETIHQITRVLRLREGDKLILQDTGGKEILGEISDQTDRTLYVKALDMGENSNDPEKKVTLYCAILKRENFELVAQKATEIGISHIVPVLTTRTVKTGLNMERLEKIIKEAAEQSGRSTVPTLSPITQFEDALNEASHIVLFDGSGAPYEQSKEGADLFIGPEGGFTEEELHLAKEKGAEITSLSKLTFRGETAAIIASYLAIY